MSVWLHNFQPSSILLDLGVIKIHWYSFLVTLAILVGLFFILKLTKRQRVVQDHLWNLFFYLIIFGLIGARFYHVLFYNLNYFWQYPLEIFMVWQGGLAIHGAVIIGLIVIYLYTKKHQLSFWQYSDLFSLVLPLGQAVGRWGNYFNQELFGKPCEFNWCLPIESVNRPIEYLKFQHFHPVFLYESLLNLVLFVILFFLYKSSTTFLPPKKVVLDKTKKLSTGVITFSYLIGYSVIRFFIEFLRLDVSQTYLGLKWVQWLCLGVIIIVLGYWLFIYRKRLI